ncbi:tripartite tricarboxylate transporter substrate binding protein [Desulforhopalus sp. 52FAK]
MKQLLSIAALVCVMALPSLGLSQDWAPKDSIKLQIGFGAGGSTDIMGRLVAAKIEENTGWNVVVENKPGGGGIAMFSSLMREKADGQTLGLGVSMPIFLNLASRGDKLPFNIDTFDYLATIMRGEIGMVAKADAPYNNLEELIAYAKKQKGGIAVGFDAKPQQMVLEPVAKKAGVKFKFVKHKSGAEQVQSILGGHVDIACTAGEHVKYIKSGDLKLIASMSKDRQECAPESMTLIENGFDLYLEPYFYIAAPKDLPEHIKAALAKAFDEAINSESVKEGLINSMQAKAHNLGPVGTYEMMSQGAVDIKALVKAAKTE